MVFSLVVAITYNYMVFSLVVAMYIYISFFKKGNSISPKLLFYNVCTFYLSYRNAVHQATGL